MSFSLIEHLAKQLDLPDNDISTALSQLVEQLNKELQTIQSTHLPGIGTFEKSGDDILYSPDNTLSLAVNSRFGALENELVHAETYEDISESSENIAQRNEENIDKSLLEDILPQNISENFFEEGSQELTDLGLVSEDVNPFDDDLLNTDQENSFFSTQKSSNETPDQPGAPDAASMKEEDPKSNQSEQESADSNAEWSPFFEELEGEEFDIDTTIDLSADDWESEFPTPPSSPFSSSASDQQQEDLYFDVDAAPDDTLFSTSSDTEAMPQNPEEDLSWAANPLDESTEFFDDDASLDSAVFQSGEDKTATFTSEDEFFSPVTGSGNTQTPDDTLFSAETIYAEDATQEADDTIFLAPDQTVQAPDMQSVDESDQTLIDPYAPPATQQPPAPAPDRGAENPYAYRPSARRTQSSNSWMMVAISVVGLAVVGLVVTYLMGLPPFGSGSSTTTPPPVVQNTPPPSSDAGSEASMGGVVPGETTDGATNPGADTDDPAATTPAETTPPATNSNPVEQTPIIQRTDIVASQGGWTIVVASELQRNSAERIVDNFTVEFANQQYPVGILTTTVNGLTRHRVGVGQFSTKNAAAAALRNFSSVLPSDAWLSKIE